MKFIANSLGDVLLSLSVEEIILRAQVSLQVFLLTNPKILAQKSRLSASQKEYTRAIKAATDRQGPGAFVRLRDF